MTCPHTVLNIPRFEIALQFASIGAMVESDLPQHSGVVVAPVRSSHAIPCSFRKTPDGIKGISHNVGVEDITGSKGR